MKIQDRRAILLLLAIITQSMRRAEWAEANSFSNLSILRLRRIAEMVARPVQKPSEAFRRTCPYGWSIRAASARENSNERESAALDSKTHVEKLWKDLGKITAE